MRIPLRRLLTLLTAVLGPVTAAALTLGGPAYADRSGPSDGVWPLAPRPEVVARFDPPATRWGVGHRGADLLGRAGQPVRTALAGRVSFAGMLAGRGVVVVDHGRTRTTYEPVAASVSVGRRVAVGAVLGRLQVFGSHCFPRSCLHWGLIEGRDHYLDPLTLVGAGPVRLVQLHEVGGGQFHPANSFASAHCFALPTVSPCQRLRLMPTSVPIGTTAGTRYGRGVAALMSWRASKPVRQLHGRQVEPEDPVQETGWDATAPSSSRAAPSSLPECSPLSVMRRMRKGCQ